MLRDFFFFLAADWLVHLFIFRAADWSGDCAIGDRRGSKLIGRNQTETKLKAKSKAWALVVFYGMLGRSRIQTQLLEYPYAFTVRGEKGGQSLWVPKP